jgi:trans-2,3-dihydro-3-hydroxyanthranilate isomerase
VNSKRFVIADVFTEKRFGGNQLAVFPDAAGLDDATMQDIAREMNYSETTFLLPAESGGDFRIRIFTPAKELPFAGHPIVGTAFVIVAEGLKQTAEPLTPVTLETGVGKIQVQVETKAGLPGHTTMNQPLPVSKGEFKDVALMATALSLSESEIGGAGLPIETIYNGLTVMIVPVASRSAVERIKIDNNAIERVIEATSAETVLVFTRETVLPENTAHCRVFAHGAGVGEDAATGSANGPFGFYLVKHRLVEAEPLTRIISEQGFEMKRPSLLHIEVDTDPESNDVTAVRVGGSVVIAGRGEMITEEE